MKNELSDGGVHPPNVSALTERGDPDCRVHAAWLAQVSKAGHGLLANEAGGSTTVSTSSSAPAPSGGVEPRRPAEKCQAGSRKDMDVWHWTVGDY
jgi:hypothetical protein